VVAHTFRNRKQLEQISVALGCMVVPLFLRGNVSLRQIWRLILRQSHTSDALRQRNVCIEVRYHAVQGKK